MLSKIKNHKFSLSLILAALLFMIPLFGVRPAHASQGPAIAIKPNYSKSQIKPDGVFFVRTKPGETQTLSLSISNLSNVKQTVSVSPANSYTSDGGSISYSPTGKIPKDKSLKYKFKDLAQGQPKTIELGPNKKQDVTFTVNAPQKSYKGVILGAIYVNPLNQTQQASLKGVTANNRFALAMPVTLKEKDTKVNPKLTALDIKPNQIAGQTYINSRLANERPQLIQQMSIKDRIYRKSDPSKTLSTFKQNGMSMAPNSNFNLINNFERNTLLPGEYHLSLHAKAANGQHWNIEKDFHVSVAQATINNGKQNWWWIILLILLLILILILCYVLYRQHKKQKQLLAQQNGNGTDSQQGTK